MRLFAVGVTAAASLAEAAPAHHSFAQVDLATTIALEGEVNEFRWTNPHSAIVVDVVETDGSVTSWRVEMSSAVKLFRQGWRRGDVAAGDRVMLEVHPMHGGEAEASLVHIVLPDGSERGDDQRPQ